MKRRKHVRKLVAAFLCFCVLLAPSLNVAVLAQEEEIMLIDAEGVDASMQFDCRSALLMEAETGKILFEQNADEALPPASVTKIMTLLLIMEAIERGQIAYDDMVSASAHACSMGGSQIFLEEGEQMSVEDLLKSVIIASANDAAVALAEYVSGTEEAFVAQMNERASQLGMENTKFENTNGLDDTTDSHLTSARDIAKMSQALLKHEKITQYSSIWMDTIRNGEFGLTNTNRLVRFYRGATGLKTGSTSKAGFCISATAKRDGMHLICVIMGAESRDVRNAAATSLLDWGFANYALYESPAVELSPIRVLRGVTDTCAIGAEPFRIVVKKSEVSRVEYVTELPEAISSPVERGNAVGNIRYMLDGKEIGTCPIVAKESIAALDFLGVLLRVLARMAMC